MNLIFEAIYQNGVLVPQTPAALTDGERVRVSVQPAAEAKEQLTQRLPDSPLFDNTIEPPYELPHGESRVVATTQGQERYPDGIGF